MKNRHFRAVMLVTALVTLGAAGCSSEGGGSSPTPTQDAGVDTTILVDASDATAADAIGHSDGQVGSSEVVDGAGAVSQTLQAVADGDVYAYTYLNWNNANWGAWKTMSAGWHQLGGEKRTYLRFDLGSVTAVTKATLVLRQIDVKGKLDSLAVHRVTSAWSEGQGLYTGKTEPTAATGILTWEQQPDFEPSPSASLAVATATPATVEVDVTAIVKAWVGGEPNHGLMIKTAIESPTKANPQAKVMFATRESVAKMDRPRLEVQ
ncbi:MAG: DNRLRE domain-containing protein [Myxococcales bacterium]|nr:DNRLRE domain-containing protein [Myxococcales bacterium]